MGGAFGGAADGTGNGSGSGARVSARTGDRVGVRGAAITRGSLMAVSENTDGIGARDSDASARSRARSESLLLVDDERLQAPAVTINMRATRDRRSHA